ncbi:GAP family protein [Tessaracoccus coleopterorum]|uniref:GAP family protein n=1 Tax=Tessaracoccus coleopterorum TaxID=2714950 RepID=UPI0022B250B2|nr:GAP family protein [Tessaracoccus coleopterorum]
MLALAVRQWRGRPEAGTEPQLPAWMSKIDTMGLPAAVGLAFALAAVNPKNLLVSAAAGSTIGRSGVETATAIAIGAVFTVIAALSVAVPVVLALAAPAKAATALAALRTWLTINNATIMAVVMALLGAQVIGKGLGSF